MKTIYPTNEIVKHATDIEDLPPIPEADEDIFLSEEYLNKYVGTPVGQCLAAQLDYNSRQPHRTTLKEMNDRERAHIADPLDYLGTPPDNEIRWTK